MFTRRQSPMPDPADGDDDGDGDDGDGDEDEDEEQLVSTVMPTNPAPPVRSSLREIRLIPADYR
jgi:hypothetical protein